MIENLDPLLIVSMILMQIGARYLDLELTEFQRQMIKNKLVQAIILFGIIYIPVRDIKKTLLIIFLIYLIIYVLLNENHRFNIYSKKWLYTEGIIKEYNDFKNKYYLNLKKIMI